jgi:hypothetical protein
VEVVEVEEVMVQVVEEQEVIELHIQVVHL